MIPIVKNINGSIYLTRVIESFRLLGGLGLTSSRFDIRGEIERVTAQNRVAAVETPTPGCTMINAELAWHPEGKDRSLSVLFSANNIFNVNARRHSSFLKDYAPLAGRDFRITLRYEL